MQKAIFDIDEQTLQDLQILKDPKGGYSIFDFFNHVRTIGGRNRLHKMMCAPSNEIGTIRRRMEAIQFFAQENVDWNITNNQVDFIEHYLASNLMILKSNIVDVTIQNLQNRMSSNRDYYLLSTGVKYVFYTIKSLHDFFENINIPKFPEVLQEMKNRVEEVTSEIPLQKIFHQIDLAKSELDIMLTTKQIAQFDLLFRKKYKTDILNILEIIFELDVFLSVAAASNKYQFTFPYLIESEQCSFQIEGMFHPLLQSAVKNDFSMNQKNLCFLTGSNMSGKSTLLKSIGLSIYLAHLGFPVPAKKMETTVFNGIMTTINLSDSLEFGHSHFLSEVKRVKTAVVNVIEKRNYLVVFDELFRGTNVKDAYVATAEVVKGFANFKDSLFIISSHQLEVADELKSIENMSFCYLGSNVQHSKCTFRYKLEEGVSKDRLGMLIIQNEGIFDLLKNHD